LRLIMLVSELEKNADSTISTPRLISRKVVCESFKS